MLRCFALLTIGLLMVGCAEPLEPIPSPTAGGGNSNPQPVTPATSNTETDTPKKPATPAQPKKGIIHQTTDQVVDAKEWLQKEGIEAQGGNIEGVDPFSQAASGYFTLAAKTSTLGLQQQVQHYRALNDRFPTYPEFKKMMQDNRIEFSKLRYYEIYAYNEDTGKILVLVDTVAKEEGTAD